MTGNAMFDFRRRYSLPSPADRPVALHVNDKAAHRLRAGYPFVYDSDIERGGEDGEPGDLAVVYAAKKRALLAVGLFDPTTNVRARILHRGKGVAIDGGFFRRKIDDAIAKRKSITSSGQTTGVRLVHGENDDLGDLVVDRYGHDIVIKIYSHAWWAHLDHVVNALVDDSDTSGRIVLRLSRRLQDVAENQYGLVDGQLLHGKGEHRATFVENGIRFECDIFRGQKTGFFLDQRDNRLALSRMSRGQRVLNVFSYSGGFSLFAAAGGAEEVTSLDISRPALEDAERNFQINDDNKDVSRCKHITLAKDAFDALAQMRGRGLNFDVVVLDPPAFARNSAQRDAALSAYKKIAMAGLDVTAPGGRILLASCSRHICESDFVETCVRAARERRRPLAIETVTGHAPDHPVRFEGSRYLKCIFATC